MCGYRRPGASQPTNTRIKPLILEMISANKELSIYHFECTKEVKFRGIRLNLAAALEDELIARISPMWNVHGRTKERPDQAREPARPALTSRAAARLAPLGRAAHP